MRPGAGSIASTPSAMTSRGISSAIPAATAAATLDTFTSPTRPVMASKVPTGVRIVTAVSNKERSARSTKTSASSALSSCVA